MKISRRSLTVLLMTIVLILFIQLIRLNLVLSLNSTAHTLAFEYRQDQAQNLALPERGLCGKRHSLIIYNPDQTEELANLTAVLRNMQFQQDTMTAADQRSDYSIYDLVLILDQDAGRLADLGKITAYAEGGGHLLYLGNGSFGPQDMLVTQSGLFGIEAWDTIREVERISFRTELLSGVTGELDLAGDSSLQKLFQPLRVQLAEDCLVHAKGDQDSPVIWERGGTGSVMVINTGAYADKRLRGLLTGAISVFLDTVLYPVTQSAVWQIINIPVDVHFEAAILKANYSRDFHQYILDIWWRDMAALQKKYSLIYTVAYLGSFNDNVDGPFGTQHLSGANLNILTQAIIKGKGEISYQGYNHHPLVLVRNDRSSPGNKPWPDHVKIVEAIQSSADFLKKVLPNYQLFTYVPPDSELDDQSVAALRQCFPELKTISGIYFNPPGLEDSQDPAPLVQEFSVSEWYGVAFPQVSAGCFLSDGTRFDMASVVTAQGIISHLIAADEILDPERSHNLLWEDLYHRYDQLFKQAAATYGWLNPDTVTTAAEKLKQAMNLDLYYAVDDRTISLACGNFAGEATLILTTGEKITGSQGCSYQKIDSIRYLVTMHEKTATLEVGPE
jgi:hypothetical protein